MRISIEDTALNLKRVQVFLLLFFTLATPIIASGQTYAQSQAAIGQISLAVGCLEFPDANHTVSVETIRREVVDQVVRFYKEQSYGRLTITGDVYGWYMMPIRLSELNVRRFWNGSSEDRVRLVDEAIQVLQQNGVRKQHYTYLVLVFSGSDWNTAWSQNNRKATVQSEKHLWGTYAHELGHLLGLPDLYDYERDKRGVFSDNFVGPWDIMSTSRYASSIGFCSWSRIRLGWISDNQISRVSFALTARNISAVISPLERGEGTLVLKVNTQSHPYFLVEAREEHGILITYIDETKKGGEGIVKVVDSYTGSVGDLKSLTIDVCFDLWGRENPVYLNFENDFAVVILRKTSHNYTVMFAPIEEGKKALEAHKGILEANVTIQKARQEFKLEGLEQATTVFHQATAQYEDARFTDSLRLADDARALAAKATLPRIYYEIEGELERTSNRLAGTIIHPLAGLLTNVYQKREEAVRELERAKKAFQQFDLEMVSAHLRRCNELMTEIEQTQKEAQDWNVPVVSAVGLLLIATVVAIAYRKHRQQRTH